MLQSKLNKYFLIFGFAIIAIWLFNSCKKDMFQGTTEPDVIHSAKLFVDSDPKSLKIYLDGNYLGADCPDSVKWLPDGVHKITLKHDLYPDTSFNVELVNGETKSFYINGFANPHFYNKIYVESVPVKANLILNDSITNKVTPYMIQHLLPDTYEVKLVLPNHRPDSIEVDVKKGETKYVKLYLEDTTKFVTYKTNNSGIISNNVTAVAIDKNNVKWVGTIDNGITTFDGKKWKKIEITGGNNVFQISKMEFDKLGRLWVNCSSGLLMLDNSIWRSYNDEVGTNIINDFTFDADGNIIISTDHGLYYQNGASWTIYNKSNSCLASDVVNTAFVSRNGTLWIGTNYYSVRQTASGCFPLTVGGEFEINSVISPSIKFIYEDVSGTIWFYHKKMDRDHSSALVVLRAKFPPWTDVSVPYVNPAELNNVYTGDGNNIWYCTNGGVVLIKTDGSATRISQTNSDLPILQCRGIVKDLTGNYWVSTLGYGLVQIKNGTIQ